MAGHEVHNNITKHKHMVYKTWLQTNGKRVAMLFGLRNRWKAFSISMNRRPICVLYHRDNDLGRECLDNNIMTSNHDLLLVRDKQLQDICCSG
jgi:hypothetical protein